MQHQPVPSPCVATVEIHGELTIAQARERKDECLAASAAGARVLDLRGVTHVDGAGLQILLLLRREADRLGVEFDGVVPSRAIRAALEFAQVDEGLRPVPQPFARVDARPGRCA